MNKRLQRIAGWIGYPIFYLVCLLLFAYVSAPWDRLKNALVTGFNTGGGFRMEMEDLTWSWRFPGVVASGVKLTGASPGPDEKGKPRPAPEYLMDDAIMRVSVLPLLWGTQSVGFNVDGFGGAISGGIKTSSDSRDIDIEIDDVDAAKMPYLAELLGLPVGGIMKGAVELNSPKEKLSGSEGSIELGISELTLGDGKTKVRDAIVLPKVRAGTFTLKATVNDGNLKLSELSIKGPDVEVVGDGKIRLMDRFEASLADLNLRFKFSDAYKNKDETTRGIFGAPGSSMPGLLELDPKVKKAKRDDGFYAWHITGPLMKLNFNPATGEGGSAAARRRGLLPGFGAAKPAEEAPATPPAE
jgi:type II secretion system protein N